MEAAAAKLRLMRLAAPGSALWITWISNHNVIILKIGPSAAPCETQTRGRAGLDFLDKQSYCDHSEEKEKRVRSFWKLKVLTSRGS